MYLLVVVWLLICYKFFKRGKLLQLIIAIFPVFLMLAFRGEAVGKDTMGYLSSYSAIHQSESLKQLFESMETEKGYLTLCFCLKQCGFEEQALLIIEALIFCASVVCFCKYNARDKMFMLIVSVLSLFAFALSGIRQTIALSIFLVAYKFARDRRWYIYTILALLAISFHTSAILVFPFAIIINRKFTISTAVIYLLLLLLSLITMNTVFSVVSNMLNYEEYQLMNLDGGYVSFAISLLVSFLVIAKYKTERNNTLFQQTSHYTILYMMFSAIRFVNVMMMRVVLYFTVFPYLLIDSLHHNKRNFQIKVLAMCFVVMYFLYSSASFDDYLFYWETT